MGDDAFGIFQREGQLVLVLLGRDDAQRQRLARWGWGHLAGHGKGPTIIATR
jgi:hypothetical protein